MPISDTTMLHVLKLVPEAILPTKNYVTDAGYDLYALEDKFIQIGTTVKVSTGIAAKIPDGFVGMVCTRGSMGSKGLEVGAGIIDAGYNGEIQIVLHNHTHFHDIKKHKKVGIFDFSLNPRGYWIKKGDKVAQLVITPIHKFSGIWEVKQLWSSDREDKAWGSSGK